MPGESALIYRSKIDLLYPLLALAMFLQGFLMLWVYDPFMPPLHNYAGGLFVGLGILATFSMLTTTYKITGSELIVYFSMIPRRIPLKGIERVADKRGFAVRLGYSRDAVEIKYRTGRTIGSVVISPKDKDTFMWDLTKAMSDLEMPNGGVDAGTGNRHRPRRHRT